MFELIVLKADPLGCERIIYFDWFLWFPPNAGEVICAWQCSPTSSSSLHRVVGDGSASVPLWDGVGTLCAREGHSPTAPCWVGLCWAALGCAGLGCNGLQWAAVGCNGLRWARSADGSHSHQFPKAEPSSAAESGKFTLLISCNNLWLEQAEKIAPELQIDQPI